MGVCWPSWVEPIIDSLRAALSLPINESIRKLDNLQQSHDSSHRDIVNSLKLLPHVEAQINGLTQNFDTFVTLVKSDAQTRAEKEEAAAQCQSTPRLIS